MFRLFECCALSFFERFVLSFSLKIERFVSDSAEIWICGLYISDLYTRKNDKRLLAASRDDIDVQEAVFRLNNRMETAQQWRTVEKIDTLMKNDDELIRLRTNIRKSAEAKVANGTLTVTEMLREVTAEDQAKQTKALHEIQRLQALYDIKYTMNH